MTRVALYVRVSTMEQKINGLSLDAQREALTKYAQEKGYSIVDTYADEGITARKQLKNRKELQRLLSDVKKDKIDLILVTKLDRWFRNIKDYYQVQEILEAHNCNWRTIFENYDTSTASGRLHINIMLSVNQDECDRTSERIKAVFKHKKENKEVCSGNVPYGYYIDENKHMQIDEEKAKEIQDAYNYYELHNNVQQTRKYLSDKYGYITYTATRKRLTHEAYTGTYNGIKDFCPAIISAKQYKNVQRLMDMNKKQYKPKAPQEEYIFSGMIKCKSCGGSFSANRMFRSGKCYKFYRCQRAKREQNCTNKYTISEKGILETYLLANIKNELSKYKISYEVKQANKDIQDLQNRLVKARNKLDKLKDLYLDDLIDKDAYRAEYARLNGIISDLENEINNDSDFDIDSINKILSLDFESIYHTLKPNEKRYIWQSIIDYIEVGDNRNDITIHFR